MTALLLALGGWLAVAAPEAEPPASKDDIAEAQRHFQRAVELYDANKLPEALAEFRRAYAIAPANKLLYNIGELCYVLQDLPCAYESLTRYLERGGPDVTSQRREEVQRDLSRLQSRVGMLRIRVDQPGAEVTIDNVPVGRTPITEPVVVTAGRAQVRVTLPGRAPVTRVVEVAAMETATVEVALDGEAPGLPERAPPRVERSTAVRTATEPAASHAPTYAWIATAVLAAGAGATGGLALWSSADLKDKRELVPADAADLASRSRRTKRLALATDVLIGATALVAGVATVLSLTAPERPERVALRLSPVGISLEGSF
jgi:hypothetical protein